MPPVNIPAVVLVVALFVTFKATAVVVGEGKTVTLTLERASHEGMELSQLRERDRIRHGRFLQQQQPPPGAVDFPVQGTYDPYLVGLYYTQVQLGTPPKSFYVQIDTGSDVLWVSCNPCIGCPITSGLKIDLEFFDPSSSSTSSLISCSDPRCMLNQNSSDSGCSLLNQCGYSFQYGDGSGTSGYYVSDSMSLERIVGNSRNLNDSAAVVFGCSTTQSGDLTNPDRAVDGIFGFGQNNFSVISQLYYQGITPHAFSHCLSGENGGGGILVLGQIVENNLVYTPMVPGQPHYNVNLESISVNGQKLVIDPLVFATSDKGGTIIDSGTTLAYLAEEAYGPFVHAINQSVPESVRPLVVDGNQCYETTSSVSEVFPSVSLNFDGGASMILNPADYLLQEDSKSGGSVWCIGIQENQGIAILGDLVLQNKIVVYDLAGQRIGWANYNCSSPVTVSTSSNGVTQFVNLGQIGNNTSASHEPYKLTPSALIATFLHILFFGVSSFL